MGRMGYSGEETEGSRKAFSSTLHGRYDWEAKAAVARYFGHAGHKGVIWDPYGQYDCDLAVDTADGRWHIEVEVRPDCWLNGRWKYPTIHFLERKTKYLKHDNFYLWALDETMTHAVIIPGSVVREAKKIHVPNKYAKGELYYDIPIEQCAYRAIPEPAVPTGDDRG